MDVLFMWMQKGLPVGTQVILLPQIKKWNMENARKSSKCGTQEWTPVGVALGFLAMPMVTVHISSQPPDSVSKISPMEIRLLGMRRLPLLCMCIQPRGKKYKISWNDISQESAAPFACQCISAFPPYCTLRHSLRKVKLWIVGWMCSFRIVGCSIVWSTTFTTKMGLNESAP